MIAADYKGLRRLRVDRVDAWTLIVAALLAEGWLQRIDSG
jgi:hypothetical protein